MDERLQCVLTHQRGNKSTLDLDSLGSVVAQVNILHL